MSLLLPIIAASHRGSNSPGDPYWDDVESLLHFDGPDGSTVFTDETGLAWTVTGSPKIKTDKSKFGGSSLYMHGLDSDLNVPSILSASDKITLEMWFYLPTSETGGQYRNILAGQCGSGGRRDQFFGVNFASIANPMLLTFYRDGNLGPAINSTGSTVVIKDTWHHVALTYDGAIVRGFLNGNMEFATACSAGWVDTGYPFRIGRSYNPPYSQYRQQIQGYIDDFRVTKGVARYTASFTPPSAPFPNHS